MQHVSHAPVGVSDRHLSLIATLLERTLAPGARVYLFGSRARLDHTPGSDVDLAIASEHSLERELSRARSALEESSLPYTVDLVELARCEATLRERVRREGVLLWTT